MLYVGIAIGAAFIAFIWWRITSVSRGMRQRNERILRELDPIGKMLGEGEEVTRSDVARLAKRPELRLLLRSILSEYNELALFPKRFDTPVAEGEALLAYWMMHPNELGDPPAEISLATTVSRVVRGKTGQFLVFRYRMAEGHWAGSAALLGFVGPFFDDESPYNRSASAFSRAGDRDGVADPDEIVDWYVGMAYRR